MAIGRCVCGHAVVCDPRPVPATGRVDQRRPRGCDSRGPGCGRAAPRQRGGGDVL